MKCDYCQGEDHLETACIKKNGERTFTVGIGCLLMALLSPFLLAGAVIGAIASAFMEGFACTKDIWKSILKGIRGKRDEEPTV